MYGVWMMGYGDMLCFDVEDVVYLLLVLQLLFVGFGFVLDVLVLLCWYLCLLLGILLFVFVVFDDVLGDDLFVYLFEGDVGCCWCVLLIEVQVVLYQYDWNQYWVVVGKCVINLLWFWGGGELLQFVYIVYVQVCSCEVFLQVLVKVAGVQVDGDQQVDVLVDLW